MDIAQLATRWNDRMLVDVSAPLTAPVIESGSLLREGAADSEIVAAEQRLGISLPDSYRQFLQHSNGAYADWDLIKQADPRSVTSHPSLGLLPAGDLVPANTVVGETIDIWMEVALVFGLASALASSLELARCVRSASATVLTCSRRWCSILTG